MHTFPWDVINCRCCYSGRTAVCDARTPFKEEWALVKCAMLDTFIAIVSFTLLVGKIICDSPSGKPLR